MTIREMLPEDTDFCVECVTTEGWLSETRAVIETLYTYDRHGCFVALVDNHRVGMIVAVGYDTCGFLGELIVTEQHRGHGIGRALMEHAIGYLQARGCHSIYLDGDTPAVPLYERIGFNTVCRSLRFLGHVPENQHNHVRAMTADDLASVIALDRVAFGANRSFFLRQRFEQYPHLCKVLYDRDRLTGYVMGQPGHGIITVGPWYSESDQETTMALLYALAAEAGNDQLRIGLLESNKIAAEHIRSLGRLEETEPSWRMVLGEDISLGRSDRLWAVGAPATG